jgi:hypothetical protein
MSFKDEWNLESALKVLQHPTVDSQLWTEAVEWLLLYGPESIRKILLSASQTATEIEFPEFKPAHFTAEGQPIYDISRLADMLGVTEEAVQDIITRKELAEEPFATQSRASRTIH